MAYGDLKHALELSCSLERDGAHVQAPMILGNPSALTLFERGPSSLVAVMIVLGAGVLVSTIDLVMR